MKRAPGQRSWMVCGALAILLAGASAAQETKRPAEKCCGAPRDEAKGKHQAKVTKEVAAHALLPGELFAAREQMILGNAQAAKGDWGVLITDARSGQVLFEQNADKYFVPASNMKQWTTGFGPRLRRWRRRRRMEKLPDRFIWWGAAIPIFPTGNFHTC